MMNAYNQTRQTSIVGNVEKAASTLRRMKGLLGKKSMPENYGLWITPCQSIHTFFMRFPIDVIFLSPDLHVVKIFPSIEPFRLSSWVHSAQSALELASGTIANSGTQVGDQVEFRS
jgi:uncharacterized membrane protein (UPF0127 family)